MAKRHEREDFHQLFEQPVDEQGHRGKIAGRHRAADTLSTFAANVWEMAMDHPAGFIVGTLVWGAVGFGIPVAWGLLAGLITLWIVGTIIMRHRFKREQRAEAAPPRESNHPGGVRELADGTYLWPDGQTLDRFQHVERREAEASLLPGELRDPAWRAARQVWEDRIWADAETYKTFKAFAHQVRIEVGDRPLNHTQSKQLLGEERAREWYARSKAYIAQASAMHPESVRLGAILWLKSRDEEPDAVISISDNSRPPFEIWDGRPFKPQLSTSDTLLVARPFRLHTDCPEGHSAAHPILAPEPGDDGIRRRCHFCPSTWVENPREEV
jgi:hypothetical protein